MASPQSSAVPVLFDTPARQRLVETFADEGYLLLPGLVDARRLSELSQDIRRELAHERARGTLFSGGGTISGHLNCFPGEGSRFVHDTLAASGVFALVQELSGTLLRAPNVGCNLNLPGSSPQNEHVDGYAAEPFLVVNVAAVDTDLANGAMEILCRTQRREYRYWEVMMARPARRRVAMKQGDVLIRTSTLWHRGMPNRTPLARPMLAFTWEDGGSELEDPYRVHGGRITFLPNRHRPDWKGRLRERAFVAAPRLGTAFRMVQSFFAAQPPSAG